MTRRSCELDLELHRRGGCLRLSDVPHLSQQTRRAVANGSCFRPFPGIVMATALREDVDTLTQALRLWQPNAVLLGRSAARLTHWPTVPLDTVSASVTRLTSPAPDHVRLEQITWPEPSSSSTT